MDQARIGSMDGSDGPLEFASVTVHEVFAGLRPTLAKVNRRLHACCTRRGKRRGSSELARFHMSTLRLHLSITWHRYSKRVLQKELQTESSMTQTMEIISLTTRVSSFLVCKHSVPHGRRLGTLVFMTASLNENLSWWWYVLLLGSSGVHQHS